MPYYSVPCVFACIVRVHCMIFAADWAKTTHAKCVLSCSVSFVLAFSVITLVGHVALLVGMAHACALACSSYAYLGILSACPRLYTFWHAVLSRFLQKVRKVHAVLFCAFCMHFGTPFCFDSVACIGAGHVALFLGCCLHMYLACTGFAFLGILHA